MIVKVCDGLYIGGYNSIWDVDTINLNYITHLIRITNNNNNNNNNIHSNNVSVNNNNNKL